MKRQVLIALALIAAACASVTPVAINAGDVCFRCKRPIINVNLASEAIAANGMVMKFRTVSCLAQYLGQHGETMAGIFVTDYPTGRFVRPETATFVRAVVDPDTNEMDYVAFRNVREAVEYGKKQSASPVDWLTIMRVVKASGPAD